MADERITVGDQSFTPDELRALMLALGGGVSPMLLAEAIATTQLSRDAEAQTLPAGEVDGG